jgi:UDP-N-acetyl-2-amino-2-deoxyglucuronate dehydrogenase
MQPLGIGIVGLGMVADAHARALAELGAEVEVRGAFARDPARRAAFAARHGLPEAASLEAMLADPGVEAILLLTPPDARRGIVEAAARAGKHVLAEKPLERSAAAAAEIVELCEEAGVTLGVVFQHRMRAASRALLGLAASGELGALAAVQVSLPWWRPQSYYDEPGRGTYARDGGGVLITQAIHTLDLMLAVTGPVAEVAAIAGTTRLHRMEAEDFVGAGLRFENGALGSLAATTAAFPGGPESIALTFERASARLEGGALTVTRRDGATEVIGGETGTGGGADPMAFPHAWHRDVIADFARAVRAGRPPAVSGRAALEVHRLIDALARSAREGRAVAV